MGHSAGVGASIGPAPMRTPDRDLPEAQPAQEMLGGVYGVYGKQCGSDGGCSSGSTPRRRGGAAALRFTPV